MIAMRMPRSGRVIPVLEIDFERNDRRLQQMADEEKTYTKCYGSGLCLRHNHAIRNSRYPSSDGDGSSPG